MTTDPEPPEPEQSVSPTGDDPFTAGDELLDRARAVTRQIEEHLRRLADDTRSRPPLPADPTDEQPPVA